MTWYEILIIAAAAAFVIGVGIYSIVRRKKGKGGCCSDCSHCTRCATEEKKKNS